MSLFSWLGRQLGLDRSTRVARQAARKRAPLPKRFSAQYEPLEDRSLLTTFFAATAADLIKDIVAANKGNGASTIVLTAPTSAPYALHAVNNNTDGSTVLPVIKKSLTIVTENGAANPAYGDTIDASRLGRLFDVAQGASLTLQNVTLQNSLENGLGGKHPIAADGGAILNRGTLVLNEVMIQDNTAAGIPGLGQDAAGGGVWSSGSLTVGNSCVFQANSAIGSDDTGTNINGGSAFGGAVYVAGGSANISGSFFGAYNQQFGNLAAGGIGGSNHADGSAGGGAIFVAGGTVTVDACTIGNPPGALGFNSNVAQGPSLSGSGFGYGGGICVTGGTVVIKNSNIQYNVAGGYNGGGVAWGGGYGSYGYGGGIFIASGATVYLDAFTLANTYANDATWFPDIDGSYVVQS